MMIKNLIEGFLGMDRDLFGPNPDEKAREIRPYGRDVDGNTVEVDYGNLEDFEGSTHLMAHDQVDGKFYAWPTLFPDYENPELEQTEAWAELDGIESFNEAKKRGELFEFNTLEEAASFAKGDWKNYETLGSRKRENVTRVPGPITGDLKRLADEANLSDEADSLLLNSDTKEIANWLKAQEKGLWDDEDTTKTVPKK